MGESLEHVSTEELLRELVRREPKHFPQPAMGYDPDTRQYILGIGRDHHAVLSMWDEAAQALGVA